MKLPKNHNALLATAKINEEKARGLLAAKKRWLFPVRESIKRLELVHLPYYLLKYSIVEHQVAKKSLVLCEGITGMFSLLGDESLLSLYKNSCSDVFHFQISQQQAQKIAEEELARLILQQNIKEFKKSPDAFSLQNIQEIALPYWVLYYEKRGKYDFRAANAISGEVAGVQLRKAFFHAFTQK